MDIEKYISLREKQRRGTLNNDEQQALHHWSQSAEGQAWLHLNAFAERYQADFEPNVEAGLARLQARIQAAKTQEKPALRVATRRTWWQVAAAALLLAVSVAAVRNWLFTPPDKQQVLTQMTEKEQLTLSDGSLVELNGNSKLEMPGHFEEYDLRTVTLRGEAYFKIQPHFAQAFEIKTAAVTVTAFQTTFNLRAYPDEATTELEVEQGEAVMAVGKQKIRLAAREKGIYNRAEKKLYKRSARQPNAQAWRTDRLVFENAPLADILQELGRYHRVRLELSNQALRNCAYTCNFGKTRLEDALQVLRVSLSLQWEKKADDHYVIVKGVCQ